MKALQITMMTYTLVMVQMDYTVHTLTFASKDEFEVRIKIFFAFTFDVFYSNYLRSCHKTAKKWLQEQCEITVSTLYKFTTKGKTYKLRCNRAGKFSSEGRIRASSSRKTSRIAPVS
ncbi:hypothetical protein COOONC_19226 [Cooperia oncophora]